MWNYRIIKKGEMYGLYEVIYNDDGEISAHDEEPTLIGESPEELLQTLRLMMDDANKSYYDILVYDKIKFAPLYEEGELSRVTTLEEFKNLLDEESESS